MIQDFIFHMLDNYLKEFMMFNFIYLNKLLEQQQIKLLVQLLSMFMVGFIQNTGFYKDRGITIHIQFLHSSTNAKIIKKKQYYE